MKLDPEVFEKLMQKEEDMQMEVESDQSEEDDV